MLAKSPVEHGGKHADRPIVTFTGGVRQATEVPGSTHLQNWTLRGVWQSKPQTSMEPIDWRYLPYIFGLLSMAYVREYSHKIWPQKWYRTYILGS
jgi:hypothetical protein